MLDKLCMYVIMFFVFSVAGWLTEVVLFLVEDHVFVNRGFLIGPYCPIYGCGVVAATLLLGGEIFRRGTVMETFFAGMVLCGALEYFTSWFMERRYHARWWDYSSKPMNLHGRIWIGNLILFGIACTVIVHWIAPAYFRLMYACPKAMLYICAAAVAVIFAVDYSVSFSLMSKVKNTIDSQIGDNTAEISRKVHAALKSKSVLLRRIHEAYSEMQVRPRAMMREYRSARSDYRSARRSARQMRLRFERAERNKTSRYAELKRQSAEAKAKLHEARLRLKELQKKITPGKDD